MACVYYSTLCISAQSNMKNVFDFVQYPQIGLFLISDPLDKAFLLHRSADKAGDQKLPAKQDQCKSYGFPQWIMVAADAHKVCLLCPFIKQPASKVAKRQADQQRAGGKDQTFP